MYMPVTLFRRGTSAVASRGLAQITHVGFPSDMTQTMFYAVVHDA